MFNIKGDALIFLKDFIKYAELYPDEMATVMWYDIDGFKSSVKLLKKQLNECPDCGCRDGNHAQECRIYYNKGYGLR